MELGNIGAVFRFEWRRSLTVPRLVWWLVLTLFPGLIVLLVRSAPGRELPREPWILLLFALVPMLVCMLGTFLWATPAVSAEIERRSWIYLAIRPRGSTAVVIGKYLATVTWVLPAALVGLAMAVALVPAGSGSPSDASGGRSNSVSEADSQAAIAVGVREAAPAIAALACLSCPAYAALYLAIGTLFPKRAMAIAVAYTLIFEFLISTIPAVINSLTVQFRMRTLLVDWTKLPVGDGRNAPLAFVGDGPDWQHVTILIVYTIGLLLTAVIVVRTSEYSSADDSGA
jgi:ABC-type transport system involved in multi-copper enzyme maturation permease subunit